MSDILLNGQVLTHEAMVRALQTARLEPGGRKEGRMPEFDEARNMPHDMVLQIIGWLRVRGVRCEARCGPVTPPVKFSLWSKT